MSSNYSVFLILHRSAGSIRRLGLLGWKRQRPSAIAANGAEIYTAGAALSMPPFLFVRSDAVRVGYGMLTVAPIVYCTNGTPASPLT